MLSYQTFDNFANIENCFLTLLIYILYIYILLDNRKAIFVNQ